MDRDYLNKILKTKPLTAMQYRILLTLMLGELTKAQLAEELDVSQQSINPTANQLLEYGLVKVVKQEGRNQYLACDSNIIIAEAKAYNRKLDDAIELFNEFNEFSYNTLCELEDESSDDYNRYKEAILLICNESLYTEGTLLQQDLFFSDMLNCEDDSITCSLENIINSMSTENEVTTTTWAYSIKDYDCIEVEYTFINKEINLEYIDDLIKKEQYDTEVWDIITNEAVRITKINLI